MTDTVRTISALLSQFADAVADLAINPQTMRDFIVTMTARSLPSVAQLGALPSALGSTNSAAFQAALDSGTKYFVPAGTYALASILVPKTGAALIGENRETTILTSADSGQNGSVFRHYDGSLVSNFTLANMTLTTSVTGGDLNGVGLCWFDHSSASNWLLQNLKFTAPAIGLNAVTAVLGDYQKTCSDLTISECIFDGVARMGVELLNQHSVWTATTAYSLNALVSSTVPNGFDYLVTTAGTTGGSEPTWPTTVSGTVTNGSVVFTCIAAQYAIVRHNLLRNRFRNIGSVGGWSHSFSGRARDCLIADNVFESTAGNTILCENAGASFSIYRGNRFLDWGSASPLSVSDGPPQLTGNLYIDNIFDGKAATGAVRIADSYTSKFSGNQVISASSVLLVNCTDCEMTENYIDSSADNFVGIDGGTRNRICNNSIDNTRATSNTSGTVLFNSTSKNLVVSNRYKLASGGTQGVLLSGAGSGNLTTPNFVYNGTTWTSV